VDRKQGGKIRGVSSKIVPKKGHFNGARDWDLNHRCYTKGPSRGTAVERIKDTITQSKSKFILVLRTNFNQRGVPW